MASRRGIQKFLCRYEKTKTIARKPGSGLSSKVNDVKKIVEEKMTGDDETTGEELRGELAQQGFALPKSTVLRCRRSLGRIYRDASYCQLIREANKSKQLEWALQYRDEAVGDGSRMYSGQMSVRSSSRFIEGSVVEREENHRATSQGKSRSLY